MPFINTTAHEKFIQLIRSHFGTEPVAATNAEDEALKTNMDQLQKIVQEYKKTFYHLQGLTREYRILLRRTRLNIRKRHTRLTKRQKT